MKRRRFIRVMGLGGSAGLIGAEGLAALDGLATRGERVEPPSGAPPGVPLAAVRYGSLLDDAERPDTGVLRLVILHTNDTHSRLEPFPEDGGPFAGLGGAARRATLIRRIREANEHVLLLDSGDILQGTPYFNFFGGELEFRAMSAMQYDVATLGNHDFDNGIDGLASILPEASFQFVSANYDIHPASPLAGRVAPYTTREIGGIKVGIFGLGVAFERLVLPRLHEGVTYRDPVAAARTATRDLRKAGCSLVICLSHLGYTYANSDRPSDRTLAVAVPEIDIILGGHTHTFLNQAEVVPHSAEAKFTLINQAGWGGMRLGRIDVAFDDTKRERAANWTSARYKIDRRIDELTTE